MIVAASNLEKCTLIMYKIVAAGVSITRKGNALIQKLNQCDFDRGAINKQYAGADNAINMRISKEAK